MTSDRMVFSVSQLNLRARQLLETHFPLIWVEGELSNVSRPSSGHWYFTLKDSAAQVRCAMFRNRNQRVRIPPQQGQHVLLRARVSLYEGRGDYQLIVEHMEDAGHGALQRAFEELKHRLLQEGLFEAERKKPLPEPPKHLGVITSPTGAALRDVLQVLKRRYPCVPVSVFPVAVQGSEAAPQIVRALDLANRHSDCDLLILCRGGGSLEDLWAFNEESVARAVAKSRIPIVSGVGHETDTTITDFVADLRAPTPSAAAELATPDQMDLLQQFQGFELWLKQLQLQQISSHKQQLAALRSRIQHPAQRLQNKAQQVDHLELRLRNTMASKLNRSGTQLTHLLQRCRSQNPNQRLQACQSRLQHAQLRLSQTMNHQIVGQRHRLNQLVTMLEGVSPLAILSRGYSVTKTADGRIVRQASEVKSGDRLVTRLGEGEVHSTVD